MAKKRSKNLSKNIMIAIFLVVAIFALMVVSIPQISTNAESSQALLDFVTWFANLRDHFSNYVALYAFLLAVLSAGYYFLVYKPKAK